LHIAALGPAHPVVGAERHNLGLALGSLGKTDEASTELRRALSIWEASIGPDHPNSISARYHLAGLLREQGKLDEAESEHRRALAQRIEVLGPEHPHVAASRNELALVLADRGRHEESETEQREALKVLVAALGDDHPDVASIRINLADLLLARGEIVEALSLAETAWERKRGPDEEPGHQAESAFVLARALRAAGDPDRARTLARRAISAYERAGVGHAEDVAEVRRWLRERF
jgi:tetratricopeptide (TPR) repeat protein